MSTVCADFIGLDITNPRSRWATDTHWHYDPTDPLAITVVFVLPDRPTEWTISRDSLGDAYLHPITGGDVQIHRDRGQLHLSLSSGDRCAEFIFPADLIWEYLRATHRAVPPCRNAGACTDDCFECSLLDTDLAAVLAQH